jgi:hypothetical protein
MHLTTTTSRIQLLLSGTGKVRGKLGKRRGNGEEEMEVERKLRRTR